MCIYIYICTTHAGCSCVSKYQKSINAEISKYVYYPHRYSRCKYKHEFTYSYIHTYVYISMKKYIEIK